MRRLYAAIRQYNALPIAPWKLAHKSIHASHSTSVLIARMTPNEHKLACSRTFSSSNRNQDTESGVSESKQPDSPDSVSQQSEMTNVGHNHSEQLKHKLNLDSRTSSSNITIGGLKTLNNGWSFLKKLSILLGGLLASGIIVLLTGIAIDSFSPVDCVPSEHYNFIHHVRDCILLVLSSSVPCGSVLSRLFN